MHIDHYNICMDFAGSCTLVVDFQRLLAYHWSRGGSVQYVLYCYSPCSVTVARRRMIS